MVRVTSSSTNLAEPIDVLSEAASVQAGPDALHKDRQLAIRLPRGSSGSSGSISVSHGGLDDRFTITLHRTIRVPDNSDTNSLPPSCGQFPLYRIGDYASRLPADMRQKGGLFFPMYQREAMWVGFSARQPFAVKIYVGGVNAVSGFSMVENEKTAEKRRRLLDQGKPIQDYMVVPNQPWLDGIVSDDGAIRQFVAQPKGSGFSVETQVTGQESVGGIQIEIVPVKKNMPSRLEVRHRWHKTQGVMETNSRTIVLADHGIGPDSTWLDLKKVVTNEFDFSDRKEIQFSDPFSGDNSRKGHPCSISFGNNTRLGDEYFPPGFYTLDVREHNMVPIVTRKRGAMMAKRCAAPSPSASAPQSALPPPSLRAPVKEMGIAAGGSIKQTIAKDPFQPSVWDEAASVMLNLQILDVPSFCSVTGLSAPSTPVSPETYAAHGYPFFEIWNEKTTGIRGHFEEVKSVAQINAERAEARGDDPPEEEESFAFPVITLPGFAGKKCFRGTFKPVATMSEELERMTLS